MSETRKARIILAGIQKEIEIVSKKLSDILNEIENSREKQKVLLKEISSQEIQIIENKKKIESLTEEIRILEENKDSLILNNINLDKKVSINQEEVEGHNKVIDTKKEEEKKANSESEYSLSLLSEKQKKLKDIEEKIENKKIEFSKIESDANKEDKKVKLLKIEQNEIDVAIEKSIKNFRVFERRIAQFSKDTGYIVGYPRPIRKKICQDTQTKEAEI
jgi:chromosome segregation ATPase